VTLQELLKKFPEGTKVVYTCPYSGEQYEGYVDERVVDTELMRTCRGEQNGWCVPLTLTKGQKFLPAGERCVVEIKHSQIVGAG